MLDLPITYRAALDMLVRVTVTLAGDRDINLRKFELSEEDFQDNCNEFA